MIHTIGSALKECITKSMLKSNRLTNNLLNNYYFIKTNLANLMATRIKRGVGRRNSFARVFVERETSEYEAAVLGRILLMNGSTLTYFQKK